MSSISSVNCDFLLVWRLFRNLMNTRLHNLTITSQAFGFGVKYPEPTILERFIEKGARVLKAVVFDMDETLLSINLNAFILRYFKDVSSMLADIGRRSHGGTMARLGTILVDLNANRRSGTDNRTNLGSTKKRLSAGAAFASRTHSSTRRLPTTTAKFFRTRTTMSSTPTPCRAHTPRFRPYRVQGYVARSLPTPAFRRGHRVPHGLGRPGRRPL